MEDNIENQENVNVNSDNEYHLTAVSGLYENWFLDYASYVILERAVPLINDGLKPVQRRILHAMKEIDDGRFNKVANVIGQTMQYHPHGDAAIGDAMVNLGQKDILIETQGNWGDYRTGDSAAAPRYIEARLSKFALDVGFNAQTTKWQTSYDGRKKEPVALPMKFPLLLAQGVDGIAVGLSTKILPHNFNELILASIDYLKGKSFEIFPDFATGGFVDVSNYNDGKKGGKVRVRAKIEEVDKKILLIKDVPYGETTTSLIESIVKANDSGKIKIKKVIDNTAKDVEIEIQLATGVSPDITIDALYAFTSCEVSLSPNACVIVDDRPEFLGSSELLKVSTDRTLELLRLELQIKIAELEEEWHYFSLEKIFIEKRIYRDIEECETFEDVIDTIWRGLKKHKKLFKREITENDILKLTEIKIKRISKYDSFKADERIFDTEAKLAIATDNLNNIRVYTIGYFENIYKKYNKGRDRKTEIRTFDTIDAKNVAIANQKLYVNRAEGFVGTGLKKDEFICDCSDLDDIIVFRRDGKMQVSKISDKIFMGKDIIYVDTFQKSDDRKIYNMIYLDGKTKISYAKRFAVTGITRDKEYDLTQGTNGSRILYFTANPSGEAEIVNISLSPLSHARKLLFDFDFSTLAIKGRQVQGNILSKYLVKGVKLISKGFSTLGGLKIWFDNITGRLNTDERGKCLGSFHPNDAILAIYKDGNYELTNYELTNHYDVAHLLFIAKFKPKKAISCVYFDSKNKQHNVKRFLIETQSLDKKFLFIPEGAKNQVLLATDKDDPIITLITGKNKKDQVEEEINLSQIIEIKGWKAIGNRLTSENVLSIELHNSPEDDNEVEDEIPEEINIDLPENVVNEDLLIEEEKKIKKLLSDEDDIELEKPKPKLKNIKPEQPKLF